jgi:hypothetical protein
MPLYCYFVSADSNVQFLRISVDNGEYMGFVEVSASTSLADLRAIIARNLDAELVPESYMFLKKNGEPVNPKTESKTLVKGFFPAITIAAAPGHSFPLRVQVKLWTNALFKMWTLPKTTFGQLREEAARFWLLNPADTLLEDAEGVLWSDTALVHEALQSFEAAHTKAGTPVSARHVSAAQSPLANIAASLGQEMPQILLRMRERDTEKLFAARQFRTHVASPDRGKLNSRSASSRQLHKALKDPNEGQARSAVHRSASPEDDLDFESTTSEEADTFAEEGSLQGDDAPDARALIRQSSPFLDTFASASSELVKVDNHTAVLIPRTTHTPHVPSKYVQPPRLSNVPHVALLQAAMTVSTPHLQEFAAVEPHLWRIFTYYAVAGDAVDPFHLRSRQWRCFLDDCGLLLPVPQSTASTTAAPRRLGARISSSHDSIITPQIADVIFSSAVGEGRRAMSASIVPKGKLTMSAAAAADAAVKQAKVALVNSTAVGMDYLQFLRALIAISVRVSRQSQGLSSLPSSPQKAHSTRVSLPSLPPHYISSADRHFGAIQALYLLTCSVHTSFEGLPEADAPEELSLSKEKLDHRHMHTVPPQQQVTVVTSNERVAESFMEVLRASVLPHASSWNADAWLEEVTQITNTVPSSDVTRAIIPDGAEASTPLLTFVQQFAPALRLLFNYYAHNPLDDPAAGPRAVSRVQRGRSNSTSQSVDMRELRDREAASRRAGYAGGDSEFSLTDAPTGSFSHRNGGQKDVRIELQTLGVSPNSVVGDIISNSIRNGRATINQLKGPPEDEEETGSVLSRRSSVAGSKRAPAPSGRSSGSRNTAGGTSYAATMLTKLARLKPSADGIAEGDSPPAPGAVHTPSPRDVQSNCTMRFAGFLRFVADTGLGSVGALVITGRNIAEAFVASAATCWHTNTHASPEAWRATAGAMPEEVDMSRVVLSFDQFVECLCRLVFRLGSSSGSSSASSVVKLKALLQQISETLDKASAVDIFDARKEHTSANPEFLMRGIVAFQNAFKRMAAADGEPNYITYAERLVAEHCKALVEPSVSEAHPAPNTTRRNSVYKYRRRRANSTSAITVRRVEPPVFSVDIARLNQQVETLTAVGGQAHPNNNDQDEVNDAILTELKELDALWNDQRQLRTVQEQAFKEEQRTRNVARLAAGTTPTKVTLDLRTLIAPTQSMLWSQMLQAREVTAAAVHAATVRMNTRMSAAGTPTQVLLEDVDVVSEDMSKVDNQLVEEMHVRSSSQAMGSLTSPVPNARFSLHSNSASAPIGPEGFSKRHAAFSPMVGHRKGAMSLSLAPSINRLLTTEGFEILQPPRASPALTNHDSSPVARAAGSPRAGGSSGVNTRNAAAGARASIRYLSAIGPDGHDAEGGILSRMRGMKRSNSDLGPLLSSTSPVGAQHPSGSEVDILRLSSGSGTGPNVGKSSSAVSATTSPPGKTEPAVAAPAPLTTPPSVVPALPLLSLTHAMGNQGLPSTSRTDAGGVGQSPSTSRALPRASTGLLRSNATPERVHLTSRPSFVAETKLNSGKGFKPGLDALAESSAGTPVGSRAGTPPLPKVDESARPSTSEETGPQAIPLMRSPSLERSAAATAMKPVDAAAAPHVDVEPAAGRQAALVHAKTGDSTASLLDPKSKPSPRRSSMEPVDLANTHTRDVRKPSETRDGTRAAAAPAPARIQAPADTVENTPRVSEDHKGAGADNTADPTHAPVRVDPAKADTGTLESKSSRSHQPLPQVEAPAGPGKRAAPSPTHLPAVPEAFIPAAKSGTTSLSPPPAAALESSDSASSHTFSSKPPATAAHHPRDRMIIEKRLLFKRMLLDGKVFRKYGRRGFPHARRVVLSADLRYIMWGLLTRALGVEAVARKMESRFQIFKQWMKSHPARYSGRTHPG